MSCWPASAYFAWGATSTLCGLTGHCFFMPLAWAQFGTSALELVGKETFDLILLDLIMPEMSGFEVLRRLKTADAAARLADPPFEGIALSRKPTVETWPRRGSRNHRGLCTRGTGVGLRDTPGHTMKTVPAGC
jgi:hypothetical protein